MIVQTCAYYSNKTNYLNYWMKMEDFNTYILTCESDEDNGNAMQNISHELDNPKQE